MAKKNQHSTARKSKAAAKKRNTGAPVASVADDDAPPVIVRRTVDPACPPRNRVELSDLLREVFEISVPSIALMEGSVAPLDYLCHSFFEGAQSARPGGAALPRDTVVWANRGGGKTFLGAVATLLDLIYKPGIEVRILGGSLEQSRRMHEHLQRLLENPAMSGLLGRGAITDKRVRLGNRSRAEVLAQSQASVRGTRVQKVRCDEVELFDPQVWQAVQLTTRSAAITGPWGDGVPGVIEALSTMHRPMGLMWEITSRSIKPDGTPGLGAADVAAARARRGADGDGEIAGADDSPVRTLFRWGAVDSLERCDASRPCETCGLAPECGGRAKRREAGESGHIRVDDALRLKARVSAEQWDAEMLCLRPSTADAVFPEFDPRVHVFTGEVAAPGDEEAMLIEDALAPRRLDAAGRVVDEAVACAKPKARVLCGMDFGVRSPTVILWALHDAATGAIRVVDESIQRDEGMQFHARTIERSRWGMPAWIGVDPAGTARNDQTMQSNVQVLQRAGLRVLHRRTSLHEGVRMVRARLRPALHEGKDGPHTPRLFIHARCVGLIEALSRYHYDERNRNRQDPVKDGHDHAADALRYLVVNLDARHEFRRGRY